jgi:hypothetical protein
MSVTVTPGAAFGSASMPPDGAIRLAADPPINVLPAAIGTLAPTNENIDDLTGHPTSEGDLDTGPALVG